MSSSSPTTSSGADYTAMADKLSAAAIIGQRRDSRKRRRLSERRRVFSRAMNNQNTNSANRSSNNNNNNSNDQTISSTGRPSDEHRRSDSPTLVGGDSAKMSMKIQFHITVAPEDEPLILDTNHLTTAHAGSLSGSALAAVAAAAMAPAATRAPPNSVSSQLDRGSSSRGSRRNHLFALHNQQAQKVSTGAEAVCTHSTGDLALLSVRNDCNTCRKGSLTPTSAASVAAAAAAAGRDSGARSSTITGGMADESTMRFLASRLEQPSSHLLRSSASAMLARSQPVGIASGSTPAIQGAGSGSGSASASASSVEREQIYFKRDGQRFGHEFTLKLAVDRTYRCLLKVRPLIPLQSISIQGHQVVFVDCSQGGGLGGGSTGGGSGGELTSFSSSLNGLNDESSSFSMLTMQQNSSNIRAIKINGSGSGNRLQSPGGEPKFQQDHRVSSSSTSASSTTITKSASTTTTTLKSTSSQAIFASTSNQHHNSTAAQHQQTARVAGSVLQHAQTVCSGPTAFSLSRQVQQQLLQQQQRQQMIRHFAVAHCTSSSSHLGSQLIYMFDWPAARFEVNKNKNRTHVQTVLKFRNGQILSLPLQVKFYQAERKQHLNWGSRLHFIDYDCNINSMGQINVEKIQYY